MVCLRCRADVADGEVRCSACRRRVRPLLPVRLFRPILVVAVLVSFGIGVTRLRAAADEQGKVEAARDAMPKKPKGSTTTTSPTTSAPVSGEPAVAPTTTAAVLNAKILLPSSIRATVSAEPAQNGCGQTVTYDPPLMIDGDPSTAWRTVGDGRGVKLTVFLSERTKLTEVGLIPGYDKRDQCTGVDRFTQMRRVSSVRWSFDDGTSIEQTFSDTRELQSIPVSSTTSKVEIEILSSTQAGGLNYVTVSEVSLSGVAAPQ